MKTSGRSHMKFHYFLSFLAWLVVVVAAADAGSSVTTATNHTSPVRLLKTKYKNCVPPPNAVTGLWFYDMLKNGGYMGCTSAHDTKPWIMLNAYRGGSVGVDFWRYKDDKTANLPCLKNWTYYGKDGVWFITKVAGEYTMQGDTKLWCAMARYRKRGKQGYQWDYCTCEKA